MKLYLLRHGETIGNRDSIIQGQTDGMLSSLGRQQAKLVGERLQGEKFDYIYCSDLQRTRETLEEIICYHDTPVEYTEEIRERSFGIFENRPFHDYVSALEQSGQTRITYPPPDGENFIDLQQRTSHFLERVKRRHLGESILACSHGGTIRALLGTALSRDLHELLLMTIENTSLCVLEFHSETGDVLSSHLNDVTHLAESEGI